MLLLLGIVVTAPVVSSEAAAKETLPTQAAIVDLQREVVNFKSQLKAIDAMNGTVVEQARALGELSDRLKKVEMQITGEGGIIPWARSTLDRMDYQINVVLILIGLFGIVVGLIAFFGLREARLNYDKVVHEMNVMLADAKNLCNDSTKYIIDKRNVAEKKVDEIISLGLIVPNKSDNVLFSIDIIDDIIDKASTSSAFDVVLTLKAMALKAEYNSDWRVAVQHWDELAKINQNDIDFHFNAGYCKHKMASIDVENKYKWLNMARSEYELCLKLGDNSAMTYNNLGTVFGCLADTEDASQQSSFIDQELDMYEKAIKINSLLAMAYKNLGDAYVRKANLACDVKSECLSKALTAYGKSIDLDGGNGGYYCAKGFCLLELSEVASEEGVRLALIGEAKTFMLKALGLDESKLYDIACFYALTGDVVACKEALGGACDKGFCPSVEQLSNDKDLISVREFVWFGDMVQKAIDMGGVVKGDMQR